MRIDSRQLTRALALVTILISLSLSAPDSRAQSQSYAVEMVIFANTDADGLTAESWRANPGQPDVSRAAPLSADGNVTAINANAYRLSGIWQALRSSSQYVPLRHLAWTQPGYSTRSAPQILIGDSPASDIFGTVQMSRARFLHLDLDLLLHGSNGSYRFINHRRMRSNELNYIDHPLFGVLVIATPVE